MYICVCIYTCMYASVYMVFFDVWTVFHILCPSRIRSLHLSLVVIVILRHVFVLYSLPLWVFPFTRCPWKILSLVIKYVCMYACILINFILFKCKSKQFQLNEKSEKDRRYFSKCRFICLLITDQRRDFLRIKTVIIKYKDL